MLRDAASQLGPPPGPGGAEPDLYVGAGLLAWYAGDRLVVVNFAPSAGYLQPPDELPRRAELLASTDPARLLGEVRLDRFVLLPREAVLLETSSLSRS